MNGYVNGSDLLLFVGGKAIGHCTSHTLTFNSETKDRAVKPLASLGAQAGLWKGKGVTGLSMSISAEGLRFYDEAENGWEEIAPQWGQGASVTVKAYQRGESGVDGNSVPYVQGSFIIASIEETSPAQDDAAYSITLENDGEPEIYPGKGGGFISLNASKLSIKVGDKVTIQPTVLPDGTSVTWSSSATAKATVAAGLITAVAAGTSTITAQITVDGTTYKDTCEVTVTAS